MEMNPQMALQYTQALAHDLYWKPLPSLAGCVQSHAAAQYRVGIDAARRSVICVWEAKRRREDVKRAWRT